MSKSKSAWPFLAIGAIILGGYLLYSFYPEAARTVKMHNM